VLIQGYKTVIGMCAHAGLHDCDRNVCSYRVCTTVIGICAHTGLHDCDRNVCSYGVARL
jgi:hypothetical protein